MIGFTQLPKNRNLTSLSNVDFELPDANPAANVSDRLIREASGIIETMCGRTLARGAVFETFRGYDDANGYIRVRNTPVVSVDALFFSGDALDETVVEIVDPDAGILYRPSGWTNDVATDPSVDPIYRIEYTGGYFVPDDDLRIKTISVANADDSYNDSVSSFSTLIKPGDEVESLKFPDASNNGWHLVTTATAAKIVVGVGGALTTMAEGPEVVFNIRSLPYAIENAVLLMVRSSFVTTGRDPTIRSFDVDGIKTQYRMPTNDDGVMREVEDLIRPWIVQDRGTLEVVRLVRA